jgi:hypothetical protein
MNKNKIVSLIDPQNLINVIQFSNSVDEHADEFMYPFQHTTRKGYLKQNRCYRRAFRARQPA